MNQHFSGKLYTVVHVWTNVTVFCVILVVVSGKSCGKSTRLNPFAKCLPTFFPWKKSYNNFSNPDKSLLLKPFSGHKKKGGGELHQGAFLSLWYKRTRTKTAAKHRRKYELTKTKQSKGKVRSAWKLLQYCQLPDKMSCDISRDIWNFFHGI